jgi:2-oxoglutarate dehydrogenase complex dehydrogenase (E1) component-like enzyme
MTFASYVDLMLRFQEEPLNGGAWTYVGTRISTAANETENHKGKEPYYAGRGPTSSVATGSKVGYVAKSSRLWFANIIRLPQSVHKEELAQFLEDAFRP